MAVLYALSGITIVKPDEVAVILRWGRLVGDTPALQEHGPGLLFAFPRPVDRVVRVQVKHVWEVTVSTLAEPQTSDADIRRHARPADAGLRAHRRSEHRARRRWSPATASATPAEWAFYGPEVRGRAARRSHGGDGAVARRDGRRPRARRRPQGSDRDGDAARAGGLDAAHSGLELSSLELTRLAPPRGARATTSTPCRARSSARRPRRRRRRRSPRRRIPQAQAAGRRGGADGARRRATRTSRTAKGDAEAFLALDREYRANPAVVRERLYRDAVERAHRVAGARPLGAAAGRRQVQRLPHHARARRRPPRPTRRRGRRRAMSRRRDRRRRSRRRRLSGVARARGTPPHQPCGSAPASPASACSGWARC